MFRTTVILLSGVLISCAASQQSSGATPPPTAFGKIAFASDRDGDLEIFVMKRDGSRQRQVTHNSVDDHSPSWAPDGRSLVFARASGPPSPYDPFGSPDTKVDLVTKRIGHRSRYITNSRRWIVRHQPSWSPDGGWIAFSHGCVPCDGASLEAVRPDGTGRRVVVAEDENSQSEEPSWASDGDGIVFNDITVSVPLQLTSFCCSDGYSDGSQSESLPDQERYPETSTVQNPEWSPTQPRILFAGNDGRDSDYDLFWISVDGSEMQALDRHGSHSLSGSWAPSGEKVVFFSDRSGSFHLYTVGADGTGVRRLTRGRHNNIDPDWI